MKRSRPLLPLLIAFTAGGVASTVGAEVIGPKVAHAERDRMTRCMARPLPPNSQPVGIPKGWTPVGAGPDPNGIAIVVCETPEG